MPHTGTTPQLHVLTDTTVQHRFSHAELAHRAFEAGVTVVQYREKQFDRPQHLDELRQLVTESRRWPTQVIVNDALDLALEVQADGVHLGQEDEPLKSALHRVPAGFIVGATVHTPTEYEALDPLPVHYLGIGPVFGTSSKTTGLPPLGLEAFARFCARSRPPVIGIGNITAENAASVIRAGGAGIAVLSAFCCADDPVAAARELIEAMASAVPAV